MSRFIETLRIRNGEIRNIAYHQSRMSRTIREHFNSDNIPILADAIRDRAMTYEADLTYKCRVTFADSIEKIEFEKYSIKQHTAIKVVETNDLDYSFKYADRSSFQTLLEQNPNYSDVLIITNGYVTDTTYANIVLIRAGKMFTPSTPLLAGTMRQSLLNQGLIKSMPIRLENIVEYDEFMLINSMMDLDESPRYDIRGCLKMAVSFKGGDTG
jgi:4-amino-4-deoxychorismate lyase